MKLFILAVGFTLALPLGIYSQNVPTGGTPTPLTAYTPRAAYDSINIPISFVRTWTARVPLTTPTPADFVDSSKYQQVTAYVDGLGRPLQEVVRGGSPDGKKDIVSLHTYDAYGREDTVFLPYPAIPVPGKEGRFKSNPFAVQQSYYNTTYNDQRPYSQTVFEASPLNRPLQSFAPGNAWAGSQGTTTERAIGKQ